MPVFSIAKKFLFHEGGDGLAGYLIVGIIAALVVTGIFVLFGKPATTNIAPSLGNSINNAGNALNSGGGYSGNLSEMSQDFGTYVH